MHAFWLTLAALVGSIVLVVGKGPRGLALVPLVVSALEVLMVRGWVRIGVAGISLTLILGGLLAVFGALLWTKAASKSGVSAATIVTAVGAIQVLSALHI